MTRLLFVPLLFVLVFPIFAQEEPAGLGQPLLRDPRILSQERERITLELQQTQRLIGLINPNDVQTMDVLKTQQTELVKQLRDLTQQMQSGPLSYGTISVQEVPPGRVSQPVIRPEIVGSGMSPVPGAVSPLPLEQMSRMPDVPVGMPLNGYQTIPNAPPAPPLQMPNSPSMPFYPPVPAAPNPMPNWTDRDQTWEAGQWGPRLPKELTEMKQSIEALRKEIADLKETNKALETQVQLLIRNILLSERAKESGN